MRTSLVLGLGGFVLELLIGVFPFFGLRFGADFFLFLNETFIVASFIIIGAALVGGTGGGTLMIVVGVIELVSFFPLGLFTLIPPDSVQPINWSAIFSSWYFYLFFAEYGLPSVVVILGGILAIREERDEIRNWSR